MRQILAEWARVGQTRIVNVERIPGGPMTIELNERDRSARARGALALGERIHGRAAAGRSRQPVALRSHHRDADAGQRASGSRRDAAAAGVQQQAPQFMQQPHADDDDADDELPAPNVAVPPQNRGPVFNTFPQQPQFVNPQFPNPRSASSRCAGAESGAGYPSAADRSLCGVSVPGMVVPPPPPRPASPGSRSNRRRAVPAARSSLMALVDDISAAIADAMRKHDPIRLTALRMLKAALMNRAVERGRALDDAESRQVVAALVKQRKDSIEQFTNGGRQDLADKEAAEIRVLEAYLPPAADPAAVERAVTSAIAETGATSPKDMGRVMKAAMARLAGQNVDGKAVNELVRQKLAASDNFFATVRLSFETAEQPLIHPPLASAALRWGPFFVCYPRRR